MFQSGEKFLVTLDLQIDQLDIVAASATNSNPSGSSRR
jgi:hypothetical protein